MKRLYISLVALLQVTLLSSHGFDTHTLVLLADNTWQQISTICYRALKKNVFIVSYDTTSSFQTTAPVAHGGRSHANCYTSFGFSESPHRSDVTCTPMQEFYNASTHQWVPAYMLKIGDTLLCAHNVTKIVASISLIKEPLPICTLEIKGTHTFFVTQYSVLTHNMVIPLAFSVGLSIPFGAATGGTVGGFFGPPTFLIGAAIGCAIGILAKIVCNSKIRTYTVDAYNANMFEQHIKQQLQTTTFNEPHVVLSPNYPATQQQNAPIESIDTHNEYIFYDNESEPLFSTSIQNPLPTIIGCGDTTPQKPLILITPAEPIPVFQNPGYRPLPEKERSAWPNKGCGVINDELKNMLNGSIILTAESNTDAKVNKILDGATLVDITNSGTKIYHKPKEYEDAVKDFEILELDGVKSIKGGDGLTGSLPDGRQVNVRKMSKGNYEEKDKWPTLEIRNFNGKRSKIKIRYTKEIS